MYITYDNDIVVLNIKLPIKVLNKKYKFSIFYSFNYVTNISGIELEYAKIVIEEII